MKTIQYKLFFFALALLFTFSACFKNYDELVPNLESTPAGGVKSVRVMDVAENKLQLEMKIFAVDHFGSFIQGLESSNFSITNDNSNYNYRIVSISSEQDELVGPYSAGLLFDQSGSINSTDPTDDRIKAGVSFSNLLSGGDEAAITAFSDGNYYQYPYEILEKFSKDKTKLALVIEGLAGKAEGGTPLYQAIYNLIPFVAAEGQNSNKAIIAFTDGQDTEGGVSIDDLVNLACQEGIKIYTVGLSQGVDESVLSEIAFRTGGAVMLADDALQLVSLYSSLGELLHGEGHFYKLQVEVVNTTGNWGPGTLVTGQLNLNLSKDYPIVLPFLTNLTYENSGSLDNRQPDCTCTRADSDDLVSTWKGKAADYLNQFPNDPNLPTPNDKITCAYASIYNANPAKFKWAGLAAIVSGKIGVETSNDDFWANLLGEHLSDFETNVLAGNKAVFDDLFWQHLAFKDGGIEEIEKIYCANGISIDVYRAWLKIAQNDAENIWAGNKALLYHEQQDLLQSIIYNPHPVVWSLIQVNDNLPDMVATPILVSPVPGHNDAFPSDSKYIDYLADRWSWIENSILPAWESYQMNPANAAPLKEIHKSYCASCCN